VAHESGETHLSALSRNALLALVGKQFVLSATSAEIKPIAAIETKDGEHARQKSASSCRM
jgi:hypothetical protein